MNRKGFVNIILIIVIVILAGAVTYFASVKKSEPVVQQSATIPTQAINNTELNQSPTSTPTLKIYRNNKYGFEVKYPDSYYVKEDSSKQVWFFNKNSKELLLPGASIEVIEKNIDSVVQELKNQEPGITQVVEEKDIIINNQTAKKLVLTTGFGVNHLYYILSKNDSIFLLGCAAGINDQINIFSTFKFTE